MIDLQNYSVITKDMTKSSSDYKLEFTAEATQVASRKLASLDRECRLVLTTDQTNVLELAAFAPDQRFKVTVELAD